jgi:hypothetical protein
MVELRHPHGGAAPGAQAMRERCARGAPRPCRRGAEEGSWVFLIFFYRAGVVDIVDRESKGSGCCIGWWRRRGVEGFRSPERRSVYLIL